MTKRKRLQKEPNVDDDFGIILVVLVALICFLVGWLIGGSGVGHYD